MNLEDRFLKPIPDSQGSPSFMFYSVLRCRQECLSPQRHKVKQMQEGKKYACGGKILSPDSSDKYSESLALFPPSLP